jgi:hypothetical protein
MMVCRAITKKKLKQNAVGPTRKRKCKNSMVSHPEISNFRM